MRPVSEWSKAQKINAVAIGLVAMVGLPLFTAILLSMENPLKHSVTEMTFRMGYRAAFTVWGLCFIAFFLYTTIRMMRESGFRKGVRTFFYVYVGLIELALVVTGAISDDPQKVSETMIKAHNYAAYVMFVGHFALLVFLTVAAWFRNKLQGGLNTVFCAFFAIVMIFQYVRVNVNDSFAFLQAATAFGEGTAFVLIAIFLAANYIGNLLFLPSGKTKLLSHA